MLTFPLRKQKEILLNSSFQTSFPSIFAVKQSISMMPLFANIISLGLVCLKNKQQQKSTNEWEQCHISVCTTLINAIEPISEQSLFLWTLFKSLSVLLVLHYGCADQDQISGANLHHILTGASPGVLLSFWINKHDSTHSFFYHLCDRGNNRTGMCWREQKTTYLTSSPKKAFPGVLPGLVLIWTALV